MRNLKKMRSRNFSGQVCVSVLVWGRRTGDEYFPFACLGRSGRENGWETEGGRGGVVCLCFGLGLVHWGQTIVFFHELVEEWRGGGEEGREGENGWWSVEKRRLGKGEVSRGCGTSRPKRRNLHFTVLVFPVLLFQFFHFWPQNFGL